MTTKDPSRFMLVSKALRRSGVLLLLAVAGGTAAGCGSSSGSNDAAPFPEFEGVWAIDDGDDTSSLNCPQEVGLEDVPFTIWGSTVTMEAGILTDLVETDDVCRFNYNVMGKVATMPTTDPYTGKAPTCRISLSSSDQSNVVLDPNATPVWTFKLLAPLTGQAPTAQIVGTADATVMLPDSNSTSSNPPLITLTPCMFAAQVNIHKIAKP